jgi:hypothetical protein
MFSPDFHDIKKLKITGRSQWPHIKCSDLIIVIYMTLQTGLDMTFFSYIFPYLTGGLHSPQEL